MNNRLSGSGLKLRILGGCLVSAILTAGVVCRADDMPGSHNCRDDSISSSTVGASRTTEASTAGVAKLPSVRLSWDASVPASTRPVDAVEGYNIYRHEPGKIYQQINLVLIHETSCTDYAVKSGHTYLYQAKAVSAQGAISKPSNQATARVRSH